MDYDEIVQVLGKSGRYEVLLVCLFIIPSFFGAFLNLSIVFVAGIPEHWCHVPDLSKFNLTAEQIRSISIPLRDGGDSYDSCAMYDRNYSGWTEADVAAAVEQGGFRDAGTNQSTTECLHGWVYDKSQYQSTIVSEWDLVCQNQWLRASSASVFYLGMMIGVAVFGNLSDAFGRKPSFCVTMLLQCVFSVALPFSKNYITFLILRFFVAFFSMASYICRYVLIVETVAPSWRVHASTAFSYAWSLGFMAVAGICYGIRDWFTLQLVAAAPGLVVLSYVLLVNSLVYYGLSLNTTNLGGDAYLNFFISGAVEIPATILLHVSLAYLGRRLSLAGDLVVGGLALTATVFVPEGMTWLVITLVMIGKFSFSMTHGITMFFTAELHPTLIRTASVAAGSLFSRFGAITAPYLAEIGTNHPMLPPLIFGTAALTAGLLALPLPETKDKKLPETLQDSEEFGRTSCTCTGCFKSHAVTETNHIRGDQHSDGDGAEMQRLETH